jgi:hypothetical protein
MENERSDNFIVFEMTTTTTSTAANISNCNKLADPVFHCVHYHEKYITTGGGTTGGNSASLSMMGMPFKGLGMAEVGTRGR